MTLDILEDEAHLLISEVTVLHCWQDDLASILLAHLRVDSQLLQGLAVEVEQRLLVQLGLPLLGQLIPRLKVTSLLELSLFRHKFVFPDLLPV